MYQSECNGIWEHSYALKIGTLDNPGWTLTVDLTGTKLEDKELTPRRYGVEKDSSLESIDWIDCKVEEKQFRGHGGPEKLEEIVQTFLDWAHEYKGE